MATRASTSTDSPSAPGQPFAPAWKRALLGGGTEGNERLTAINGAVLIVPLAVIGITIINLGGLLWLR
jgi:hypothetical protein